MKHNILVFLLTCFSVSANAKLLFEGYLKIELHGKHIGYVVQKDEIDDTSKERTLTYLVWEDVDGLINQDGLQVVAKPSPGSTLFAPLRFTNWQWSGEDGSITTGKVDKKVMTVLTKDIASGQKIDYRSGTMAVPAHSIFSAMATQTFAESDPAKFGKGQKAAYPAFDEEDAKFDTIEMQILDTKAFGDQKISQIFSELRNEKMELYTFADGQPLGLRNDYTDKVVYLVNKREEAFGDFGPADTIKKIFGDVPRGLRNPVSDSQGKLNAKDAIDAFVSLKKRKEQDSSGKKH